MQKKNINWASSKFPASSVPPQIHIPYMVKMFSLHGEDELKSNSLKFDARNRAFCAIMFLSMIKRARIVPLNAKI